jgi:hypothetical protein
MVNPYFHLDKEEMPEYTPVPVFRLFCKRGVKGWLFTKEDARIKLHGLYPIEAVPKLTGF